MSDECIDIDECLTGLDNCPMHTYCNNTEGSFECFCEDGFELNVFMSLFTTVCDNIIECDSTHDCDQDSIYNFLYILIKNMKISIIINNFKYFFINKEECGMSRYYWIIFMSL